MTLHNLQWNRTDPPSLLHKASIFACLLVEGFARLAAGSLNREAERGGCVAERGCEAEREHEAEREAECEREAERGCEAKCEREAGREREGERECTEDGGESAGVRGSSSRSGAVSEPTAPRYSSSSNPSSPISKSPPGSAWSLY